MRLCWSIVHFTVDSRPAVNRLAEHDNFHRPCHVDIPRNFSFSTSLCKQPTVHETPATRLRIGERCFSFAGSAAWNFYACLTLQDTHAHQAFNPRAAYGFLQA